MTQRYQIGETVQVAGLPSSQVVGLDRYTLHSLTGKTKHWVSYTLSYEQDGEIRRWWMSDEPAGLYLWSPVEQGEVKGIVDLDESGLCILQVEGDSTISSPCSSVALFRDGDTFYCLEAFPADGEVFSMRGMAVIA